MLLFNIQEIYSVTNDKKTLVTQINLHTRGRDISTELFDYICNNFINLEELIIIGNTHKIPNNICKLKKLRRLWLNHNSISSIPIELGELVNLEEIELKNTKIIALPQIFANFQKLNILIDNNPVYNNNVFINGTNMLICVYKNYIDIPDNIINLNILDADGSNLDNLPLNIENLRIRSLSKPLLNLPPSLKTLEINKTRTILNIKLPHGCTLKKGSEGYITC